jgi:hypothetical protein
MMPVKIAAPDSLPYDPNCFFFSYKLLASSALPGHFEARGVQALLLLAS